MAPPDPSAPDTSGGPMIRRDQRQRVIDYINIDIDGLPENDPECAMGI
ncbi:hypothetical protein [Streptomyces sp. NPDC057428]